VNLGTRLLGSLLVIPNVMLLFTKRKQSLADILTHTVVVRYEQPAPPVTAADKLRAICVNLGLVAAIIGIGDATFGPFLMLMSENDNLIPIRNDLVSYTDLLETYFRKNGAMPASLDVLGYKPESFKAHYVLTRDAVLYALFMLRGHNSYYSLYAKYDAATDTITWHCRSRGISEPLRRNCPDSQAADSSSVDNR